jgi:hypothetical protein
MREGWCWSEANHGMQDRRRREKREKREERWEGRIDRGTDWRLAVGSRHAIGQRPSANIPRPTANGHRRFASSAPVLASSSASASASADRALKVGLLPGASPEFPTSGANSPTLTFSLSKSPFCNLNRPRILAPHPPRRKTNTPAIPDSPILQYSPAHSQLARPFSPVSNPIPAVDNPIPQAPKPQSPIPRRSTLPSLLIPCRRTARSIHTGRRHRPSPCSHIAVTLTLTPLLTLTPALGLTLAPLGVSRAHHSRNGWSWTPSLPSNGRGNGPP